MKPSFLFDVVHRWAVLCGAGRGRMAQTASRGSKAREKPAGTDGELDRLFLGNSELAGLMRSYDWAATPLGPPESWPQSLKTAVRIMLTSRQPIWIGWGRELIYLYNDPYKSIIGGKHPWALGRPTSEVWREIWSDIGPMLATAMSGDEGTYVEAQLLIMERNGYPEETYYTFSYSPIPTDDGTAGGIFCANTDDTQRVIGERQLALLRELATATVDARTWQQACERSRPGARDQSARPALRHDLHGRARQPHGRRSSARRGLPRIIPRPLQRLSLDRSRPGRSARCCTNHVPRVVADLADRVQGGDAQRAPGIVPAADAVVLPICRKRRDGPVGLRHCRPQPVPSVRRAAMPASSTSSPARSPRRSPTPRPMRRSAGAPRRWPRSTGPRRRSSPTSATSSARR